MTTPPLAPRLLDRAAAAAYVGLSESQFTLEVAAGTFPKPFVFKRTRRSLWDREGLDRALDARLTVLVDLDGGGFDERKRAWAAHKNRPAHTR